MFVISECWLHDHWVKEFANQFDTRKLAMKWADNEVKDWLNTFNHFFRSNCYDTYKSNTFTVYRENSLWYRYVIKNNLAKDELELKSYLF